MMQDTTEDDKNTPLYRDAFSRKGILLGDYAGERVLELPYCVHPKHALAKSRKHNPVGTNQ